MKRFLLMASALVLGVTAAMAVPAKPGVKKMLTLKDGTRVEATLRGDEHVNYFEAADGRAFQLMDEAYQQVDREALTQLHAKRMQAANQRRLQRSPRFLPTPSPGGYHGTKRGLVIMVQFADRKFTYGLSDFTDFFNKTGYNDYGIAGSVHDYFYAQSYGQFDLEFDVVGPVTMSGNISYYAGTSGTERCPEMVNEVCKEVDNNVNFSTYDWDNDGTVDQVYVVYAGYSMAEGAENTIWPHESSVRRTGRPYTTNDGVRIDTYGISNELMGDGVHNTGRIGGIGSACHEFSHCLGLPDFYDVNHNDGTQGNFGMSYWDVMDSGEYNDNGYSPCGYTAYERWWAGWLEPVELKTGQQIVDMPAIQDEPLAYIMYNDADRNEYYLLENYQQKDFDAAGSGHGLLVIHVDYNTRAWTSNKINTESDHQRMTIIAADNSYSAKSLAGDPFPGKNGKNQLTNTSTPKATLYNENRSGSKLMDKPITRISEKNGLISFIFMGGASLDTPLAHAPSNVTDNGFTATWDAVEGAQSYTVSLSKIENMDQSTIIFEEDFEKFTMETMTEIYKKDLDEYTTLPGWSGKNLYGSSNKLRVGKVRNAGELETPRFKCPLNDSISVLISVYNAARLGTGNLQLRVYPLGLGYTLEQLKEREYYMYLDITDIPPTSEEEPLYIGILAPWSTDYGDLIIGIYPDEDGSGVYMDYLAATDGLYTNMPEFEDEEEKQPAKLPVRFSAAKSVNASWTDNVPASLRAKKAPRRVVSVTNEVFTSTTNSYTFTDLVPAQYTYSVRAQGADGIVSDWSNDVTVDLTTGIEAIHNSQWTVDDKAAVYDLAGRKVSRPSTSSVLPKGIYIRNGRRFVVK